MQQRKRVIDNHGQSHPFCPYQSNKEPKQGSPPMRRSSSVKVGCLQTPTSSSVPSFGFHRIKVEVAVYSYILWNCCRCFVLALCLISFGKQSRVYFDHYWPWPITKPVNASHPCLHQDFLKRLELKKASLLPRGPLPSTGLWYLTSDHLIFVKCCKEPFLG